MEHSGTVRKNSRSFRLLSCFMFGITVLLRGTEESEGFLQQPTGLKAKLSGNFANVTWNPVGSQGSVYNYSIEYCYPCGNCSHSFQLNYVPKSTLMYRLRLPVKNVCYKIKMRLCIFLKCGKFSNNVTLNTSAQRTAELDLVTTPSARTFSSSGLDVGHKFAIGICTFIGFGILVVMLVVLVKFIHNKLELARNIGQRERSDICDCENPGVTNQGLDVKYLSSSRSSGGVSDSVDSASSHENKDQSTENEGVRGPFKYPSIPAVQFVPESNINTNCQLKEDEVPLTTPIAQLEVRNSIDSGYSGSYQSRYLDETNKDELQGTLDLFSTKDEKLREDRNYEKGLSVKLGTAKKIISLRGGILEVNDVSLRLGEGCLSRDTEITMILGGQDIPIQRLLELDFLKVDPLIIEFRPDGLKFLKPAHLTVPFQPVQSLELFVLHGTFRDNERGQVTWEILPIDDFDYSQKGYVGIEITGFCFFCYIMACKGELARIMSHLNHSFNCYAIALYRRLSPPEIDVAVVLLSEYVQNNEKELEKSDLMIKLNQKKYKYRLAEQGTSKRINTHGSVIMRLEFSGIEHEGRTEVPLDQAKLDSLGMVTDKFQRILKEFPAQGKVHIEEIDGNNLWSLNIVEEREVELEKATEDISNPPDEVETFTHLNNVVRRPRLNNHQIVRMSRNMAMDWDSLAGLMDIPYEERESLKLDNNYKDPTSKAEKIITMINEKPDFTMNSLSKCLKEMDREDLWKKSGMEENSVSLMENKEAGESVVSVLTPLSAREMCRVSRMITAEWDSLAGLLGIPMERKDDIKRNNNLYPDEKSKAEKTLSLYNNSKKFSRTDLASYLKEVRRYDLCDKVRFGSLRTL